MGASTDLPELLTRVSQYYTSIERRRGGALRLELDPALAPDLAGPYAVLGDVLCLLLDRAFAVTDDACVALQVDVVGDTPDGQLVHITVADPGETLDDNCPRLDAAARRVASLDGVLHRECAADRGTRVIIEVTLTLPRHPPRIDIETLRTTLGGTHALREVISALDRSLSRDLAELDVLLGQPGIADLQAWLHRVSGALGMAEATDLARMGLTLERHLAEERDASIDAAIRRFGEDAARALQVLRKHA
jgi:HPt (histidine-containing phosphotransfer) domain-containing protein